MNLFWNDLAAVLHQPVKNRDFLLRAIGTDSRTIQPGDVFLAIVGETYDGHDFLAQAVARGAAGCILSHLPSMMPDIPYLLVSNTLQAYAEIAGFWRRKFSIPVAAITGSVGKTSVKHMLSHMTAACGATLAPPGSFNNEVGVPQTILSMGPQHHYAVIEMGARNPGDIAHLVRCAAPTVGIVTACAPVHLETFGSQSAIAQEKGSLYAGLPLDGVAVLPMTDPCAAGWRQQIQDRRCVTFGLDPQADVHAEGLTLQLEGSDFTVVTPAGSAPVHLPFPTPHQVHNALGAIAVALAMGCDLKVITQALAHCPPLAGRVRVLVSPQGAKVIDDSYNANPVAVKSGLRLLADQPGRKIFVFGDMKELGEEAEAFHREIGQYARSLGIDRCLTVGSLAAYTAEAFQEGEHFLTQAALITALKSYLDPQAICLIKGSHSMRMFDIVTAIAQKGDTL